MDAQPPESSLIGNFDFSILESPHIKEDSVREVLILPLLKALGYSNTGKNRILRSPTLEHPWVTTGSGRRKIKSIPDYLLTSDSENAWILDAKAPGEKITGGKHVQQAYFYAIHPDIRIELFALCNGREFALFHISRDVIVQYFHLSEIEQHWDQLVSLLAPESFQQDQAGISIPTRGGDKSFDYLSATPPPEITDLKKQSARRHYGVHGYFTKQVWNVVQQYITTFTQPGDTVLDPYGGSGVTVIEALILGRKGIHIDINPHSIFLVKNLIAPVKKADVAAAYQRIVKRFNQNAPRTKSQVDKALSIYTYPTDV